MSVVNKGKIYFVNKALAIKHQIVISFVYLFFCLLFQKGKSKKWQGMAHF